MPYYYYYEGKYDPYYYSQVVQVLLNFLSSSNPRILNRNSNSNPILVPSEFDFENGLTGMKSSVNIRLMKHMGLYCQNKSSFI
jgi:hypothetical protein